MKLFLLIIGGVFAGVLAYRLSDSISHDVTIMSIGVLFGVMAGIPAALLVVASQRRREEYREPSPRYDIQRPQQQPPMIVLNGNPQQGYQQGQQQPYQAQQQPQQPPWGATGGGAYHLLPDPQDKRFRNDI